MKLARLQRWMQAVVVHPGTVEQALRASPAARFLPAKRIARVLLPSKTLSPAKRIAVYQEMYPYRMRDALAADYPGVEHFLGDRFMAFVTAYTSIHPSRGYTLNRLGDHVPAFLAKQTRFTPRRFLTDLARLELAMTEAFDERESETLRAGEFEAIPRARLEKTRLLPVPSLRLVAVDWNAAEYLDSVGDENHNHPRPGKQRSLMLVFRRNFSVQRLPVSAAGFALLEDLLAGRTLGQAVQRAMSRRGDRRASAGDLSRWFELWTSEGVFAGVEKPKRA